MGQKLNPIRCDTVLNVRHKNWSVAIANLVCWNRTKQEISEGKSKKSTVSIRWVIWKNVILSLWNTVFIFGSCRMTQKNDAAFCSSVYSVDLAGSSGLIDLFILLAHPVSLSVEVFGVPSYVCCVFACCLITFRSLRMGPSSQYLSPLCTSSSSIRIFTYSTHLL